MSWTLEQISHRLSEIKTKGFISIPPEIYRNDDGVVGQILEREFDLTENNLAVGDLGDFELKGRRTTSQLITLSHKRPESGLSPIQIFDRFGYVRKSNRDPNVLKKKLFVTVGGSRPNSLGLQLSAASSSGLHMFYKDEFICGWNLTESLKKIDKIILVEAETRGGRNSPQEQFHFVRSFLLNGLRPIDELVNENLIVVDFCIDQVVGSSKGPHDRGPHIRTPKRGLMRAYEEVRELL